MVDAVETMAWTGQTPWHGLGFQVDGKQTAKQMMIKSKTNWTVLKRPTAFLDKDGQWVVMEDKFALVRDSDFSRLSVVGSVYKPLQNETAFDFLKKYCEAGHMTMETAGSLWGGRYVWCLAKINDDFKLGKEDEIKAYLLLMVPHIAGKAFVGDLTDVRVVCWNTLNMALGRGLKGSTKAFRMPHSMVFDDDMKAKAEETLGLAREQHKEFKEAAVLLSKKKAKVEEVEEFFCEVLRFDPKEAMKKKDGEVKVPRALPHLRNALEMGPGAQLIGSKGTWWGAFNAVTFVMDHVGVTADNRDTALKNSWVGHKSGVKRRALDLALKRAA